MCLQISLYVRTGRTALRSVVSYTLASVSIVQMPVGKTSACQSSSCLSAPSQLRTTICCLFTPAHNCSKSAYLESSRTCCLHGNVLTSRIVHLLTTFVCKAMQVSQCCGKRHAHPAYCWDASLVSRLASDSQYNGISILSDNTIDMARHALKTRFSDSVHQIIHQFQNCIDIWWLSANTLSFGSPI